MQLEEIDPVDAETIERAADLLTGAGVVALPGLGGEEEVPWLPSQPGRDPELRVTVAGGCVDVIHAVLAQRL